MTKVTHEAYQAHRNFYSHIPCGMWLIKAKLYSCSLIFLLTHPVWDVTKYRYWWYRSCVHFYSHIPCGMWLGGKVPVGYRVDFYSHIPCGMWLYFVCTKCVSCNISTHTSRVGCDDLHNLGVFLLSNFYSHIPCGMWPQYIILKMYLDNFYSHIPCGMWRYYLVDFAEKH